MASDIEARGRGDRGRPVHPKTSRQGLHAVADTAQAMDAIHEQAEAVAGNIVGLSEKTQAIGEIIETVSPTGRSGIVGRK